MKRLTLLGVTVLTVGLTTLAVAAAGQESTVEGRDFSTRIDAANAR